MTRKWLLAGSKCLLGAAGLIAIFGLAAEAGVERIGKVVEGAHAWLPWIVLIEVVILTLDMIASRALWAPVDVRIPFRAWLKSACVAYATSAFLPGGRLAGEVARAGALTSWIGGAPSVSLAIASHGAHLWATTIASIVCLVALGGDRLGVLVLVTAVTTFLLGVLFLYGVRSRVGRWVVSRFDKSGSSAAELDRALSRGAPWFAVGLQTIARCAQVAQAALLLGAVHMNSDTTSAITVTSVQMVVANMGDAVPAQAGLVEGGYLYFAANMGTAAQLLSLALLLRIARLILGGLCTSTALVRSNAQRRDFSRRP